MERGRQNKVVVAASARLTGTLTCIHSAINQRAARKYPAEFKAASQRYPAPVDY